MQAKFLAFIVSGLVTISSLSLLHAQPAKISLADLIEQTEPSCVRLDVRLRRGQAIGSGFIVQNSNWVVTNYHVVAGALQATAKFSDDTQVEIEGVLAFDQRRDVAVLKLKGDRRVRPLKLAAVLPRKGESAVAIGAPQGLSFTAAEGIVSAIRDGNELKEFGNDADGTWLQTSTPISPGSSGGPLLNLQGEVIGANSGTLESGQNLNFAICAEDIGHVLKQADSGRLQQLVSIPPMKQKSLPRTGPPTPGSSPADETVVANLPAERRFRHRFKIGKEEDEFDKVVWLRTQWLPLKHNDRRLTSCGLRVGIPYREDNPAPFVVWEVGTTAQSFAFIGLAGRNFQLLVDDDSVKLGDPKHHGEIRRGRAGAGVAETMTTLLRLDGFLDIIMASKVKARLGLLEYELSKDQLECLRDLASQLPTGATGDGTMNLLVGRFTEEEDPSIVTASATKSGKVRPSTTARSQPPKPPAPDFRTWTSADGKFTVAAKFVKLEAGKIVLIRQDNGKEISVPADKLSATDQAYLRKQK